MPRASPRIAPSVPRREILLCFYDYSPDSTGKTYFQRPLPLRPPHPMPRPSSARGGRRPIAHSRELFDVGMCPRGCIKLYIYALVEIRGVVVSRCSRDQVVGSYYPRAPRCSYIATPCSAVTEWDATGLSKRTAPAWFLRGSVIDALNQLLSTALLFEGQLGTNHLGFRDRYTLTYTAALKKRFTTFLGLPSRYPGQNPEILE